MASNFNIDPDLVRKLAGLLDEANLSENEYESGGRRIRVARQVVGTLPQAPAPAATALLPAVATAGAAPVRAGTPVTSPRRGTNCRRSASGTGCRRRPPRRGARGPCCPTGTRQGRSSQGR